MTSKIIQTDFYSIGSGQQVYIIAEIGSNHNQNFDMACEMIEKAAEAKVNAVKIQTFKAKNHYSKFSPKISLYQDDIYTLIESLEIDRTWHVKLSEICHRNKIDFLDSPTDFEAIAIDTAINMPLLKISSFDMVDSRLVDLISRGKNGVIISTGMASLGEIENAINICRANENDKIILLQCTSLYPAPTHLANLKAMNTLSEVFNVITGYSDHTLGDHIPLAAVSLGAKVIEKHYTLDANLSGPDHAFAINPSQLKEMVSKIREVESAIGDGVKNGPAAEEKEMYQKARRSIHANKNISIDHPIEDSDLIIKRPSNGIHPSFLHIVKGRKARFDILKDEAITWEKI